MHVITQSCLLFIWVHTLNVVTAGDSDCKLEDFMNGPHYDSHFDTTALEQSYGPGKQVRVACQIGFVGFFKLMCMLDGWKHVGSICEPKTCGHPGDADFAEFGLVKGDDFVFGAEVQYTCQRGYQMVSRITSRRCDAQGWDGVVPVCQPILCPVIDVTNDVQISGDREEATYGNVLRFSCKSRALVLKGVAEIECDENGDWSNTAPTCIEVKCTPPPIDNGRVLGNIAEYNKDQTLSFECHTKFQRSHHLPSKCSRVGNRADWIPTPLCDPVTCTLSLSLTTIPGTRYEPDGMSLFSPDDTVTVICDSRYFIGSHSERTKVITCRQNGEWEISPVCEEITCNNPRYETGVASTNDWYGRMRKLDNTVTYTCSTGYKATAVRKTATCTRDGWAPKPLCEEIKCKKSDIPNAEIENPRKMEYRFQEMVSYRCSAASWRQARCTRDGWAPKPICEAITRTCKPAVEHGFGFPSDGNVKLFYSCNTNYKPFYKGWWGNATCNDGAWNETPRCIGRDKCGEIPQIPHAEIRKPDNDDYREGQGIPVVCVEGYELNNTISEITCKNGEWDNDYTICKPIENICGPPSKVKDAIVMCDYQKEYLHGTVVQYKCRHEYKMEGEEDKIKCENGYWEQKNLKCISKSCPRPGLAASGDINIQGLPDNDGPMPPGHNLTFSCHARGKKMSGISEAVLTCGQNEEWNHPIPSSCEDVSCPRPPADEQIIIEDLPANNDRIQFGHTLIFRCFDPLKRLNGKSELTCGENGQWNDAFPSCEVPCEVPDLPDNLQITNRNRPTSPGQGDKLQFRCTGRLYLQGSQQIECLATGTWSDKVPKCSKSNSCGEPLIPEDAELRDRRTSPYNNGEEVHYDCPRYYITSGTHTCQNGQWIGHVTCLKPCTVTEEDLNQYNIQFRRSGQDKFYAEHNDHLTFDCKDGYRSNMVMRLKCIDGMMTLPSCSPTEQISK